MNNYHILFIILILSEGQTADESSDDASLRIVEPEDSPEYVSVDPNYFGVYPEGLEDLNPGDWFESGQGRIFV